MGEVRGKGLLRGVEFVRDPATKQPFPDEVAFGVRVGKQAQRNGLIVRCDPHWLALAPPLVTSDAELDEMLAILERSVEEVL